MPFFTRTSPRHPTYDYTQRGVYFITICTADREHYLSNVIDGIVYLTQAGKIVRHHIEDIVNHFPHVMVDTYVIMPNHIHMIVCMGDDSYLGNCVVDCTDVRTRHGVSLPDPIHTDPSQTNSIHKNTFGKMHRNSLSLIINQFKGSCTRTINRHIDDGKLELKSGDRFGRQGRYHDHIIKDPEAYRIIKKYIKNNPRKWTEDRFYV